MKITKKLEEGKWQINVDLGEQMKLTATRAPVSEADKNHQYLLKEEIAWIVHQTRQLIEQGMENLSGQPPMSIDHIVDKTSPNIDPQLKVTTHKKDPPTFFSN